jgi:predicted amidohydrolase
MPEDAMGRVSRRDLLKTAAGVGTVALRGSARAQGPARRVRVAAVQMHAALGEVAANLENAEHWVRLAIREGAQWIVLPEFFTTAIALHPTKLVHAYRTLEGLPMQLLKTLAKEGNAYVGGSFLARSGADVFNTFVLASPDGQVYTHDKDFPTTNIETSVYAGGEDDEFVKELTRRGVAPDPPTPIPSRPGNVKSAVFALPDGISAGAPVVHASLVGDVWNSPANGPAVVLRFSGESQIADASGRTLARRSYAEGEGLVIAEIGIGRVPPSEPIPDDAAAWTPEVPAQSQTGWATSGAAGRSVYVKTTRPRRNG